MAELAKDDFELVCEVVGHEGDVRAVEWLGGDDGTFSQTGLLRLTVGRSLCVLSPPIV